MANKTKAAAPEAAANPVMYEVTLNGRFMNADFLYIPSHNHVVDQTIYDQMVAEGVVANVKQLS